MPVMVKTAPTNRLPSPGVVNWSAPGAGSITLVRVTEILLPVWSVTVYTVPTGPDRLLDGGGGCLGAGQRRGRGAGWYWSFGDGAAAGDRQHRRGHGQDR